jgi:hypothetical protein
MRKIIEQKKKEDTNVPVGTKDRDGMVKIAKFHLLAMIFSCAGIGAMFFMLGMIVAAVK